MSRNHKGFFEFLGLVVLTGFAIAGPLLLSPDRFPMSTRVAAMGGLLALVGVFMIARPLWRVGPLNWAILKSIDHAYRDMDSRYFSDPPANIALRKKIEDPDERLQDELSQQFSGPMWVGLGTVLNGFSGYFS